MRYDLCGLAVLTVAMAAGLATGSGAGERCCAQCGGPECEKCCRLVFEEKKVEIACYGCKAEDFCVRCASTAGCEHCEDVCGKCAPKGGVSARSKPFVWREWHPNGASLYTKKKLMRKTVIRKVPSCKWIIEDLCGECQTKRAELPPGVEAPPPPKLAKAKLLTPAIIPASATK